MGTYKLTAGDGYTYLTRHTAANDGGQRGRGSLGDYYSEKGETPGRWVGRGLAGFAQPEGRELVTSHEQEMWRVEPGSQVTEAQMKALFGLGLHPNAAQIAEHLIATGAGKAAAKAATQLGRPFIINNASTELQQRLAVAYRDHNLSESRPWNAPLDESLRAQMRTEIARNLFIEQYGRSPADPRELTGFIARQSRDQTTSTAGYDDTFSPVKSYSVLWALAPIELATILEECHDDAVADTISEYLEVHAAFARMGAQGVAQIDTEGYIAASFTHRDSRAGDPDLHTHVAVSNKVRGRGPDGVMRWLALDGRPIFKSNVPASEFYNSRLEAYASERAGVVFAERAATERGKRPVREIVGIPTELCDSFSSRRMRIKARYTDLAKAFQDAHGREPTTPEAIALHQQATLETRTAKHEPRSKAEQRAAWRTQAVEQLGSHDAVASMLAQVFTRQPRNVPDITDAWITEQAALVVGTVSEARSSWQRGHIYAEAQRRVRGAGLAVDRTLADTITAAALSEPFSRPHARIGDAERDEPEVLRRRDGASIYTTHGTHLFTSSAILAAEKRVLDAAGQLDGRQASPEAVEMAFLEQKATRGRGLNPGQQAMVQEMACSGARVQLTLAPAGAGKTTAMAALARAWEESGGHVLGLSPGANQAKLLRDDINSDCDTVDKFIWLHNNPHVVDDPARVWFDAIDDKTLIIVDEAGKAGTLQLDAVIATALARGASVRLVGDDQQLASVSAGGVLRDIERTHGALNLTQVLRFKDRAEAQAGLALREGDPAGLGFYADRGRIHVGSDDTVIEMAYQRWAADRAAGNDSMMLAPTNAVVAQLNERARLDRLQAQAADASDADASEVTLADGLRASAGDIVTTRRNKRSLRISGARDFVRNGYRWKVEKISADGALTVSQLDTGHRATLPARYVATDVTLGYAATIDSAQGMTIGNKTTAGSCHVVGSDRLSRQQLYTALTRATDENHIYLSTAESDAHQILTPKAIHPDTAIDVLERVLARDGAQISATTEQHNAENPFQRLGQAARMYTHAIGALAEHRLGAERLAAIETAATQISPEITESSAWPTLRAHLATIAIAGHDAIARLQAVSADLDTAADPAAVLDWRLDPSGSHSSTTGPLFWLPAIPEALTDNPDHAAYLRARQDLVADLAKTIRAEAADWDHTSAPRWAQPLLASTPAWLRAEIAVFRAAHDVADADTRLTGPDQYAVRARRTQKNLERRADEHLTHRIPTTNRFDKLIDRLDPRVRRDPYWTHLAAHLTAVARTGVDLTRLLADAANEGPLPDQLPGAALWWRLAGRLQPATLDVADHHLTPEWLADLTAVFGSAAAEAILADAAFPSLVAAIDNADPDQWSARDLLHLADEHLRDLHADSTHLVSVDQYARLLTYAIELFAVDDPYDYDIPLPTDIPLSSEEEEALLHDIPDPRQPAHPLSDDAMLEMLGLGYGGNLIPPAGIDELPPDPLQHELDDYRDDDALAFEDLLTERPPLHPIAPALANVVALRAAHRDATKAAAMLYQQIKTGDGPAIRAATARLRDLQVRADADRPHMLAVQDIMARWADADTVYEASMALAAHHRQQLAALQADPDADELDIASAKSGLRIALLAVPEANPAEQFRDELTAVLTARAEAAGGAANIVTAEDVEAARRDARVTDGATLATARANADRIRNDLARAETAVAQAFAEAETRSAEHVLSHITDLDTELAILRSAGSYQPQRGFAIDPALTVKLPDYTATAITAVARSGFTVTALQAPDRATAVAAMTALHTAAGRDRHILWCGHDPTQPDPTQIGLADTTMTLADTHAQITAGAHTLDTATTIVVDHAETADPALLAELAQHSADSGARLLLLHDGDGPSAPILRLLHEDLPWSTRLSTSAIPRQEFTQPDRDPVLDQARRCAPDILPPEIADALQQRETLRADHTTSYQTHIGIWDRITKAQVERTIRSRDNSPDLGV
ncbi:MobF family relaxase [[Mycobacterium] zoologicum]|uniref:MobF family relaxase n=1 Tax=[Mycobacterium] zoologicum TaxID=2872311 RepID=UPI002B783BA9|nr:MobF family relaxase [Mycolicibacter sp. MYC101]MEB3065046.1 MobF family relaxase [Mycolicibacter sp. MYC101]